MKKAEETGAQAQAGKERGGASPGEPRPDAASQASEGAAQLAGSRQSTVAKVSHTLSIALAERLEEFAFFQRVSESAVIEHSLTAFFAQSNDDMKLGDQLRRGGAGRRRKR